MRKRPGGELATRPLHFIWILDCSGSMSIDGKIQSLNSAIREAVPHMKHVADENPNAQVFVRALRFSTGAAWHIGSITPVQEFDWVDLEPQGITDMGQALEMLSEELHIPPMSERSLPPVLVLVSDGQPTDDFDAGLSKLLSLPWGKKAVRMAIAIGDDTDMEVLQRFINNPDIKPLQASSPEMLVKHIKFVSTAVLQAASAPKSQMMEGGLRNMNIPLPQMPDEEDELASATDVW